MDEKSPQGSKDSKDENGLWLLFKMLAQLFQVIPGEEGVGEEGRG